MIVNNSEMVKQRKIEKDIYIFQIDISQKNKDITAYDQLFF